MSKLYNRARVTVSSTGTGTLTLSTAVAGYQTFTSAGVQNGDVVSYVIEDGLNWEVGEGTYTSSTNTLTRTVTQSFNGSTYGTSPISVTASAQVFISPLASDIIANSSNNTLSVTNGGTGLTTLTAANNALYSTSATGLTAGTLPVAAGGTGLTSLTSGRIPFGAGTSAFSNSANLFWDSANNQFQIANGTASLPALSVVGDNNTGLWFPAADVVAASTGGSERMRIDASGNVGIGVSNPSTTGKLSVVQSLSGTYGSAGVWLSDNSTTSLMLNNTSSGVSGVWSSGALAFGSGANNFTERMRIDASGNVGIGTSSINSKLTVAGDVTATSYLSGNMLATGTSGTSRILATGGATYIQSGLAFAAGSAAPIAFGSLFGGAEWMRIDASGNVGIGTSSFGTSAATVLAIATGTAPTTGPADTIQIFSTDLSAGNTILSLRTEGTPVNANTTAATTHRIAIRVNGTVYYLLANTAA